MRHVIVGCLWRAGAAHAAPVGAVAALDRSGRIGLALEVVGADP